MTVNHRFKISRSSIFQLAAIYGLVLLFLLFFGDRVGWEGDDVDQLEGILNFQYKGKDLVYRYYWQPLSYQFSIWINSWLNNPRFLFLLPQIFGAANICILLLGMYVFSGRKIDFVLGLSFLAVLPEIVFTALYYNSTVFAMLPMAIALLFLFWTSSPIENRPLWNNSRYIILGAATTTAIFFRFDFLLSLPLVWYFMSIDRSLKQPWKQWVMYFSTTFLSLAVFWRLDIFNPAKLIYIVNSHEEGAKYWTWSESIASLYTITSPIIWFLLTIYLAWFIISRIRQKDWKAVAILIPISILLYPLPTLTSPKYLIPGIIFLPFLFAYIFLKILDRFGSNKFKIAKFTAIAFCLILQFKSIELFGNFPYLTVTSEPQLTSTHDGPRVSGAYLKGYGEIKKAQVESLHPPIKLARQLALALKTPKKNVTVIYLKRDGSIASEPWLWAFTSFYLELDGYKVQRYDRDSEIVLTSDKKVVTMKEVEEGQYLNYLKTGDEVAIKFPNVSYSDPNYFQKIYRNFYEFLTSTND